MNIVKYELVFLFTYRHLNAAVDAITHVYCYVQCRINNSSKYSNCYGPRGPLCESCSLIYASVDIKITMPEESSQKGALYRKFIRWNQGKFFILSENLLLGESTFYIVNCLKSFGFKLFFVYTFKLLRSPFRLICTKFCFILTNIWRASELIKPGSRVINKPFNKTIQKLSAKLSIGGPHGISEKGRAGRPPRSIVIFICSMDRVRIIQCSMQLTAARFRHQ